MALKNRVKTRKRMRTRMRLRGRARKRRLRMMPFLNRKQARLGAPRTRQCLLHRRKPGGRSLGFVSGREGGAYDDFFPGGEEQD
jgi:hypothetical protein